MDATCDPTLERAVNFLHLAQFPWQMDSLHAAAQSVDDPVEGLAQFDPTRDKNVPTDQAPQAPQHVRPQRVINIPNRRQRLRRGFLGRATLRSVRLPKFRVRSGTL